MVHNVDDELFLGICELQHGLSGLLQSEKVTIEQKEQIVKTAINFKKSYSNQVEYSKYTLLEAFELSIFSPEIKEEIYSAIKQNMLKNPHYLGVVWPQFFDRFYSDEEILESEKIKIAKKVFTEENGREHYKHYSYYLGSGSIPSYIQEVALNHFVNVSGYNLEQSHSKIFRYLNSTNFVSLLKNSEISFDTRLKLINLTTNPVMLCLAIMDGELDNTIAHLAKTKLETLQIPETKEVLEMLKVLVSNPELYKQRLEAQKIYTKNKTGLFNEE